MLYRSSPGCSSGFYLNLQFCMGKSPHYRIRGFRDISSTPIQKRQLQGYESPDFVLSDILVNLERISDHCSNIAGCVFEIAHNELDTHEYLRSVRDGNEKYKEYYQQYKEKFAMPQTVRAE